jgi:hypothetical protein
MNQLIQSKNFTTLIVSMAALVCFALSPAARAVLPPPDGGYPGFNTAEGEDALFSLTTGAGNTAVGFDALYSNTSGIDNTANGESALYSNTTGNDNTANGLAALAFNTTGVDNTANGSLALAFNTTGNNNVANGASALFRNTTGSQNTANGVFALKVNTTGGSNTADGYYALGNNTTGSNNTAEGTGALFSNTTGSNNTADGVNALISNHSGNYNTASGQGALSSNTTGNSNTAEGNNALLNNTTGSNNIALGDSAGINLTTGSNNIEIGNAGVAVEANTIRIGTQLTQTNTYVAGIYQTTVPRGLTVVVDSTGHLGTKGSSERFKDEIKPMDKASEAILALKPVTFHYKKELDPEGIPQFGLVAEDVEKVNPALVARDDQGKIYTVRYDAVNAMLLNEFLKEHRKVQAQEATITELKSTVAQQQKAFQSGLAEEEKQIAALASGLQKVSAQIEASKPAAQIVLNNQ